MPLVEVADLSKSFQTADRRIEVLHGLNLTVERGEMVAVIGVSGVGKSTLLQVIGGLDRPDAGRVTIGEVELSALADDALVTFRNRHVGFVFQFHHLLPEFTAIENTEMPLRIARVKPEEIRPRAHALLEQVGLADRATHRPGMLSGGEQQRVAFARALAMAPTLLLADEPTGDLDEQTGEAMHGSCVTCTSGTVSRHSSPRTTAGSPPRATACSDSRRARSDLPDTHPREGM